MKQARPPKRGPSLATSKASSSATSSAATPSAASLKSSSGKGSVEKSNLEESPLRPPDLPKKEVLVRDYSFSVRGKYRRPMPMSERLSPDGQSSLGGGAASRQQPLSRLFRPPVELLFDGANTDPANAFEAAKKTACEKGKWLLVSLQSNAQFASLRLNTDLWSEEAVKALIRSHFIFLQVEANSLGGQQLRTFYNVSGAPHIAILDPRTGEQIFKWTQEQLDSLQKGAAPASKEWLKTVNDFLAQQSKGNSKSKGLGANKSSTSSSTAGAGAPRSSVHELSEEEQMKLAIEASLSQVVSSAPPSPVPEKSSIPSKSSVSLVGASKTEKSSSWKDYLGPKVDGQQPLQFVIRFPNGKRAVATFPLASKLKALVLYLQEVYGLGPAASYELVTSYPKKIIFTSSAATDDSVTLESAGFKHRDTLYLQMK